MKRYVLILTALIFAVTAHAQNKLAVFPFQGGKSVMTDFFKNNVIVPPEMIAKKAAGTAVFKFTADEKGAVQKIIVYYADDYVVTTPFIDALRKSNKKWIIFDGEKTHDFVIAFSVNPVLKNADAAAQKQFVQSYSQHQPIFATNEVLLDMVTLLPAVIVNYPVE